MGVLGVGFLANQSTVHCGEVRRGEGVWLWLLVLVTGDI